MPSIQIQPDQLLNAALQMPEKEFQQFITRLFTAKASQRVPTLSERESELLLKINQGLPAARQERLNELIKKRRAETISPQEVRELKKLTAEVERFDVERLGLLTELAAIRNVPLRKLIKQLGLKPVRHD
ncbi:MAG: STAS/SEC14 domain-containing protein [Acidobacteria bacterium]|nr:STAS/SEC14 domain-containing protein [Acidobacteriota bacterium]MBI3426250.1 STAS/SEC14 domain-containing protein [Acidobacteriota bacterium]